MITFSQDISTTSLLMGYNNNVIRFTSDTEDKTILLCNITIGSQNITIYPNPSGVFYFNFLEWIKPIVNSKNFIDTLNPDIDGSDYRTLTYPDSGYFNATVSFLIQFTDETSETTTRTISFISGVEQLETYKKNVSQTGESIVALPLFPQTSDRYYAKYWEGFPFDITFIQKTPIDLTIENTTSGLDWLFDERGNVTRLFFSDGRTDESINDFLPISIGRNVLSWLDKFIVVDKEDVCDGAYFKWFNNYGGYSYWKFPNFYQRNQTTRAIGEINTDFENLENTYSQVSQIGTTAGNRILVNSDVLKEEEFNLLKTILTSPKIYFFVGDPFARASANDWLEVKLLTTSHRIRNFKNEPNSIVCEFELPDNYIQTL
jgi:hypothetical protein